MPPVSLLATSAGDILDYALAAFFIASGLGLLYLFIRMGGTFARLSSFIKGSERDLLPVIVKAGGTVDRVNDQLDKLDTVTDSAVSMADSADTAVRAVSTAITTPVKKVSGFAAGVSHGVSAFRARARCGGGGASREGRRGSARERGRRGAPQRGAVRVDRAADGRVARPFVLDPLVDFRDAHHRRAPRGISRRSSRRRGHLRCPSYSLVPRAGDDSTLLVTAGMQPQMPFFLGMEPPPAPLTATSQKVFRTVDIDVVGTDGHHLTFFEMLGNFSFGQYFKEGAIEFAREFVLDHMKLDWDRIWVTVHAGDPLMKLGPDEVAIDLWQKVGMPPERIVPLPTSENFWSVGGPGPCGPDSEIYWDWGEEHGCGEPDCAPACTRCDRFLEFWNLVFMEYEQHADGTLTPLPKQNIDTGLGLERGAAILQDVRSVYDTDGYQRIMGWIAAESGVAYGDSPAATKAHRILADHGRGMTFLVGDGVTPSNEGRGYVLRRIVRRAIQQGQRIGLHDAHRLSGVVAEQMSDAYPELGERADEIERVLRLEEERFLETLERGLKLFEELGSQEAIIRASRPSRSRPRTASRWSSPWSSQRSEARRSTSTATGQRWSTTGRCRARPARASSNGRSTSRGRPTSRRSSSGTRRPTSSRRSVRSRRSTTRTSSSSSGSRRSIQRAAAR